MHTIAAFVRLGRPKFLLGGFAGFGLGAAVAASAGAPIALHAYLAGQAMVTAFHLMTHFANDYFDRDADRYTQPGAFAGGSGVLVAGDLAPQVALSAALAFAAAGAALAVAVSIGGNAVLGILGAAVGVLAWCYSAPPVRLCARGLGEAVSAAVVGMLVPLCGYAALTGTIGGCALAATAAPLCAMFAMMIGVEWPDRAADLRAGKRNLVVRWGTCAAARLACASTALAVAAFPIAVLGGAPWTLGIAAVLLIVPAAVFVRRVRDPGADPSEVAAAGAALFFLTVVVGILGYIAALCVKLIATPVVASQRIDMRQWGAPYAQRATPADLRRSQPPDG